MAVISRKEISKKIENNEPIRLAFKYVNEKFMMVLNTIIVRYLSNRDQIFLLNSLITILREVVVNALKANAKRIFFIKNNLNIKDAADYEKGIKLFSRNVVGDFDIIEEDLKRSDFFVDLQFQSKGKELVVDVKNNAPILAVELERINHRMENAAKVNDFNEVYEQIEDETEGAGLGIVLTILLLKNMGINPKNFTVENMGKYTRTRLVIPDQLRPVEVITKVKKQIISDIDGIPTFPENILELQRLCLDKNSQIETIVSKLKLDPALTSDVIKLSNSAGIAPYKRIEDIKTAVMTIGLKNLNAILTASNARRILNERYSSFEQIWEHCNKVAFYARNIALKKGLTVIVENSYMAGLLHDLGKIILLATDLKLTRKIADIVQNRKITATTMEEISIGISHSSIGSLIADNWNFPKYLIEAINYHHSPLNCKKEFKDITNTIYLANMMSGIEERKYNFYYIEESILKQFDMLDEKKFAEFHTKLQKKFKETPSF